MSSFDAREEAFESNFALHSEVAFKAKARRNKMLAIWAAEKLELGEEETEAYIHALIRTELQENGDEDLVKKVLEDFQAANVSQSEHQIRRTMEQLMAEAVRMINAEA